MLFKYIVGSFWTKQLKKYDNCNIIIVSAPKDFDYSSVNTQIKKYNVVLFKKMQKYLIPKMINCSNDIYVIGLSTVYQIPNLFNELLHQNLYIHGIFNKKYFITKESLAHTQNANNKNAAVLAFLVNMCVDTAVLLKNNQVRILSLINRINTSKIS